MVNLDTLEKVEVFKDLDDRRLSAVGECCTEVVFQRGEGIFKAGQEARHLWAVAEGRVNLEAEPDSRDLRRQKCQGHPNRQPLSAGVVPEGSGARLQGHVLFAARDG